MQAVAQGQAQGVPGSARPSRQSPGHPSAPRLLQEEASRPLLHPAQAPSSGGAQRRVQRGLFCTWQVAGAGAPGQGPPGPPLGASDEDVKVAMCPEAELGCQWLPVTPNQTQQEGAGGLPEEEHGGSVKGCYHYMLGTVSIPRWALLAAPLGILLVVSALTGMLVKQNGQTRRDRITEYITRLDPPCPHQWMWYEGKCYLFSKETKTWDASQAFCASQNANMSTIGSLQEKAIVTHFKDSKDYWVGLQNKDGEWRWLDGSLLRTDIIQLRNTAPGLDCAYLSSERLGALDCATSRHWICTKDGH